MRQEGSDRENDTPTSAAPRGAVSRRNVTVAVVVIVLGVALLVVGYGKKLLNDVEGGNYEHARRVCGPPLPQDGEPAARRARQQCLRDEENRSDWEGGQPFYGIGLVMLAGGGFALYRVVNAERNE